MNDLGETQRWLQGVITDPDGVEAGVARAGGGPGRLSAEAVVHGSARLGAAERLALYSRTYHRRLAGCLRDSYPGLCHALGDELFEDFALEYLRTQPSRSYTLASLGAGWPAHLEATRPDHELPAHERESWPDFLVDLACLERTFCEVFDGPGVEGETLVSADDLPVAGDLGFATVTPVRCLRLVPARFPVGEYLVAVRRGEDPPLPAPRCCSLALSRRDYVVTITELDATATALLSQLIAGVPMSAAAASARVAPAQAWGLVRAWAGRGLVAAIAMPRPERPVV